MGAKELNIWKMKFLSQIKIRKILILEKQNNKNFREKRILSTINTRKFFKLI
jgi:hypothetical protein